MAPSNVDVVTEREMTSEDLIYVRRSLPFLRHWPVEKLKSSCDIYYFHRNAVLVRDSSNSDWIYVVLKGSLSVLKKLKRCQFYPGKQSSKLKTEDLKTDAISNKESKKFNFWNILPEKNSQDNKIYKSTAEMELTMVETLPGYSNIKERLLSIDYDNIIKRFHSRLRLKITQIYMESQSTAIKYKRPAEHPPLRTDCLPNIAITNKVSALHHGEILIDEDFNNNHDLMNKNKKISSNADQEVKREKKLMKVMKMIKNTKGAYLAATKLKIEENIETEQTSNSSDIKTRLPSIQCDTKEPTIEQQLADLQMSYVKSLQGHGGRKTVAETLDHKGRMDYQVTEADLDPVFIQVQVLKRGDYFGVVQLVFHEEPSLSVVSNGAECLVISKRLFKTWASEKSWRHLRQTECPYPSDDELTQKLMDEIKWQTAKAEIYKNIQDSILLNKSKQKQFVSAYKGEHCYRTGPV